MDASSTTGPESATLHGGPADGLRVQVTHRPRALQVTYPCELSSPPGGMRAEALYIYRRDLKVQTEPLRYGFDAASP
ncbi:hypothetical protein AAW14_29610 [Streptomyces hygroscopicus]|uniref:hypothetical protein n=1 Tax=Streptomyces hygroscopicus TaxID=1912 RepID=UPI0022406158|nr:hypothetical protein [Streptomyces hygroscopicus]MCW7946044.1 hypothetical protein [Streptomyces hygroscopicus]